MCTRIWLLCSLEARDQYEDLIAAVDHDDHVELDADVDADVDVDVDVDVAAEADSEKAK